MVAHVQGLDLLYTAISIKFGLMGDFPTHRQNAVLSRFADAAIMPKQKFIGACSVVD